MNAHLLVPIDGTDASLCAAQQALKAARTHGHRVTLLHLTESRDPLEHDRAYAVLQRLTAGFRRPPLRLVWPLEDHDVVSAVAQAARRLECTQVELGTEGTGHLTDDALGALAHRLADASGLAVHLVSRAAPGWPGTLVAPRPVGGQPGPMPARAAVA